MHNAGKRLTDGSPSTGKPLTSAKASKPVLAKAVQAKERISFSFEYFRQIEHFGLSGASPNWFASLLDRLKDLSGKGPEIFRNYTERGQYRIHPVNWGQTNIPIQRNDLNWVHKDYLKNEDEYPILQFVLSKSTGRVAGFFDETSSVFYIVLIDPKHNLQPTLDHGYKVDKTTPLPTTYEMALRYAKKCPNAHSCPLLDDRQTADDMLRAVFIDTDDSQVIEGLMNMGKSFQDEFSDFILHQIGSKGQP